MGGRPIVLFFLIDAMGWEWLADKPFLNDHFRHRQPVKTIFGFSSSAIPTILTGKYPDEHGRWNLLFLSPLTSPFRWTKYLHFLPDTLLENRVTRKLITLITKRLVKADGYFSGYVATRKLWLFDICEKYNIYRKGGIDGCSTIIDYLEETHTPHKIYSYHDYTDEQAFDCLQRDLHDDRSLVYFAYLPELDAFLHRYADRPGEVADRITWYEERIRKIIDDAKAISEDVRVFVFSDHGMAPIVKQFDLIGILRNNEIDLENDCLAVFDSTMARFWSDNPLALEKIAATLKDCPEGKLLSREELQAMRTYFPDGRYGQLIFLMHPGTLIFPNLFGSHCPAGMHGFHPDDRHSNGSYLASVADYQPESIVDLYHVMRSEVDRVRSR